MSKNLLIESIKNKILNLPVHKELFGSPDFKYIYLSDVIKILDNYKNDYKREYEEQKQGKGFGWQMSDD